jgi:hypothetical protein
VLCGSPSATRYAVTHACSAWCAAAAQSWLNVMLSQFPAFAEPVLYTNFYGAEQAIGTNGEVLQINVTTAMVLHAIAAQLHAAQLHSHPLFRMRVLHPHPPSDMCTSYGCPASAPLYACMPYHRVTPPLHVPYITGEHAAAQPHAAH